MKKLTLAILILISGCKYSQYFVGGEKVYYETTPCRIVKWDGKDIYSLSPEADTNWVFHGSIKKITKR